MARELELKLEIEPTAADRLASHPMLKGAPRIERLISVYYDTAKGKLRRQGYVLRVRQQDEGWVQTIKRTGDSAGLFDREEWEAPVQSLQPDLQAIAGTPLEDLLRPRQFRHLIPLFRADVERMSWDIGVAGGTIELTYDAGVIEAGPKSRPIHELELELKEGDVGALFAAARTIGRGIPLRLSVQSKSERGLALAQGWGGSPVRATPVELPDDANVADGFAAIVTACLRHFRLNEPLLVRDRDPEALHQLRVSIRRLRTALWLFRPVVMGRDHARINDQLRAVTRELGAARNIDVILASMAADDPAREQLDHDRAQLYAKFVRKLDTARFRGLILDMICWVHAGEWREEGQAGKPLMAFARKRLDRLWQRISKRGSMLQRLSEEERHHLRIDAKKMRYALEFLGEPDGAASKARRGFIAAAEGIQDSLGHLNDLATRRAMLAWPIDDPKVEVGKCLRAAKRNLRKMEKIGPFWRKGYRSA